jgi:hypothetical protein
VAPSLRRNATINPSLPAARAPSWLTTVEVTRPTGDCTARPAASAATRPIRTGCPAAAARAAPSATSARPAAGQRTSGGCHWSVSDCVAAAAGRTLAPETATDLSGAGPGAGFRSAMAAPANGKEPASTTRTSVIIDRRIHRHHDANTHDASTSEPTRPSPARPMPIEGDRSVRGEIRVPKGHRQAVRTIPANELFRQEKLLPTVAAQSCIDQHSQWRGPSRTRPSRCLWTGASRKPTPPPPALLMRTPIRASRAVLQPSQSLVGIAAQPGTTFIDLLVAGRLGVGSG